jgi:hypothetical protein
MLKLTRFIKHISPLISYHSSTNKILASYPVVDVKNSHLFYVKDNNSMLPYFGEVETEDGQKGVVLKLEEN